jgi:HD-like signal output (HDOD) protein
MKRILFVDDDPNVLEGLRGLLRKQRKEWQMTFAGGGEQALSELQRSAFDVLVTDMRMPGVDGATLLQRVLEEHPHTVRIVLSGQTEQEVTRRLVNVAHQFISKPFDGRELQKVIERICRLQALLGQPELLSAAGRIAQLPVRPQVSSRLTQLLQGPEVTMGEVAALIEGDAGLSAKLLQIVNASFFGLRQRVADVRAAVTSLGLELVRMLVSSPELQKAQAATSLPGYDLEAVEHHDQLVARIARRLLPDRTAGQDAFCAARLQHVGALVLMRAGLEHWAQTEAEIGGYLLGIWGLPAPVVDAVAHRLTPQRAESTGLDPVVALHVAGALADEVQPPDRSRHPGSGVTLDGALLEKLGLAGQLANWRQIAREEATG